jgi:predicted transglutaminase-like protease
VFKKFETKLQKTSPPKNLQTRFAKFLRSKKKKAEKKLQSNRKSGLQFSPSKVDQKNTVKMKDWQKVIDVL